ncbi:unnamed protein product [Blepharisma stoltei]|uniref:Uncharacterized protein n=1 Tax=Blepharisma stoltei TaxID=1481888 RepID=A0AAU9KF28_9CILI|nr:unnamed protein product [Blepharisma stoltei]
MKIQTIESKVNAGKWSREEQKLFEEGLAIFGHDWKRVAGVVKTRSQNQIRSHAQKYLLKQKYKERVVLCKKFEPQCIAVDEPSSRTIMVDHGTQYGEGISFVKLFSCEDYFFS